MSQADRTWISDLYGHIHEMDTSVFYDKKSIGYMGQKWEIFAQDMGTLYRTWYRDNTEMYYDEKTESLKIQELNEKYSRYRPYVTDMKEIEDTSIEYAMFKHDWKKLQNLYYRDIRYDAYKKKRKRG